MKTTEQIYAELDRQHVGNNMSIVDPPSSMSSRYTLEAEGRGERLLQTDPEQVYRALAHLLELTSKSTVCSAGFKGFKHTCYCSRELHQPHTIAPRHGCYGNLLQESG